MTSNILAHGRCVFQTRMASTLERNDEEHTKAGTLVCLAGWLLVCQVLHVILAAVSVGSFSLTFLGQGSCNQFYQASPLHSLLFAVNIVDSFILISTILYSHHFLRIHSL